MRKPEKKELKVRKLVLSKETLRRLTAKELLGVAGGMGSGGDLCPTATAGCNPTTVGTEKTQWCTAVPTGASCQATCG
jgi:hypothetical protein